MQLLYVSSHGQKYNDIHQISEQNNGLHNYYNRVRFEASSSKDSLLLLIVSILSSWVLLSSGKPKTKPYIYTYIYKWTSFEDWDATIRALGKSISCDFISFWSYCLFIFKSHYCSWFNTIDYDSWSYYTRIFTIYYQFLVYKSINFVSSFNTQIHPRVGFWN